MINLREFQVDWYEIFDLIYVFVHLFYPFIIVMALLTCIKRNNKI